MKKRKKQAYKFLIQTDAGVIGNRSVHSYNIRGLRPQGGAGKEFRRRSMSRLIDDTTLAEIYAITEALRYMNSKGFTKALVKTDSKMVADMVKNQNFDVENHRFGRDVKYLRSLLKSTNSNIMFTKRESNKGADLQCQLQWEKKRFSIKGKKLKGFKTKGHPVYAQMRAMKKTKQAHKKRVLQNSI